MSARSSYIVEVKIVCSLVLYFHNVFSFGFIFSKGNALVSYSKQQNNIILSIGISCF